MKLLSLPLLLSLLLISTIGAADFYSGVSSYSKRDYTTALREFKKAAGQGHASAQYSLGLIYTNGNGVDENDIEAFKWYHKAAEQGVASAQYNLGVMYDKGDGVAENDIEAFKWYRKAAEQGVASAQYNIGLMYAKGEGVVEDDIEAYKWLNLATALGHKNAAKVKKLIATRMTRAQIAEAQKLSTKWFKEHNR